MTAYKIGKKKAPKGEFLAYINKEEVALKRAGGSGHLVNGRTIKVLVGSDYSEKGNAGHVEVVIKVE